MTITNSEYVKRLADSGDTIDITNFGIRETGEVVVNKYDGTSEAVLVITTDYTINSDLDTITLNSALTSGERAVATLNILDTQSQGYTVNDANKAEKLEKALDKITLNIKKKQEKLDRVTVKQISDTVPGLVFASFANKADFYARVNANENYVDFSSLGGVTFWNDFTLPASDGSANEVLFTDGSGTLDWASQGQIGKYKVVAKVVITNPSNGSGFDDISRIKSYNVSSVSATSNVITVNFTNPTSTTDYLVLGWADGTVLTSGVAVGARNSSTKTKSSCQVDLFSNSGIGIVNLRTITLLFIK